MLKAKSVRTLVPSYVGLTSAAVSSLEEQAVNPIALVKAIAIIKAKYLIFFINLKKLVVTII